MKRLSKYILILAIIMIIITEVDAHRKQNKHNNKINKEYQPILGFIGLVSGKFIIKAVYGNSMAHRFQILYQKYAFVIDLGILLSIVTAIFIVMNWLKKKRQLLFKDFKSQAQKLPSSITKDQRQSIIAGLKSRRWLMNIRTNQLKSSSINCTINFDKLNQVSECIYNVMMKGIEINKKSHFEGVLIFYGGNMSIKVVKKQEFVFNKDMFLWKQEAVYEGEGKEEYWAGRWAVQGQQLNIKCSGQWKMSPIKQK